MAAPRYCLAEGPENLANALEELRNPMVAAVAFAGLFSPAEVAKLLAQVYAQRRLWQTGAGPGDFTLGNVWYAHMEFGREQEYFATVPTARALINRLFPKLEQRVLAFCRHLTGDPAVQIRSGWGGPAVVVFDAASETARRGGVLHIDHDGVPAELLEIQGADTFSFILPLQLPPQRGHLLVWPDLYDPAERGRYMVGSGDISRPRPPVQLLPHVVGTALAIQSLRVHQIQGFDGSCDRVTLNWRLTRLAGPGAKGRWVVWF